MSRFKIETSFLLDDEPIQLLSGAIHYFRIPKADWQHSLYNLKALGFNTVETYVPWNFHETIQGQFDFEGDKDIQRFIKLAEAQGLYVIVRPSPYICAEWDFGGLPAWLLNDHSMRMRSSDPKFLAHVERYFKVLFEILAPLQIDREGPILMFQVENEYGSFGEDKAYLRKIYALMRQQGVTVPCFTSDGAWAQCLQAGSLINDGILATGNFGSRTQQNFTNLKQFNESHGKFWPLMCMEFWDGWFNRWNEPVIKRDSADLAQEVREGIQRGSVNLYMFHGGTNFGFWNGCSARVTKDLPQVTSYDYHAPLDEVGNPTEKYFALQRMLKEELPDIQQMEPKVKPLMTLDDIPLAGKVNLFEILEKISTKTTSDYPQTMEEAGSGYGYMVYRTCLNKATTQEKLRIVEARDRVQCFVDQQWVYTAYQEAIGEAFEVTLETERPQIDVLVEHMGRVNYGYKLLAPTQRKGLGQGLMQDLHFVQGWEQFDIDFDRLTTAHFERVWSEKQPAFYRYIFDLDEVESTHIDVSAFSKGIVLVNGFNIGRYWEVGPSQSLYISKALLKQGENEVIIFDTEGSYADTINFIETPKFNK